MTIKKAVFFAAALLLATSSLHARSHAFRGNSVGVIVGTGTALSGGGGGASPAIAFDAKSSATTTGGINNQLTWSHTAGVLTNGAIVVFVASDGGGGQQVTSVSYGSLQLLRSTRSVEDNGFILSEIWYGTAPASGANTVTVNTSGSKNFSGGAISFANVAQTFPVVTSSGTAFDTTTGATSLSATANGSALTNLCMDSFAASQGANTVQAGQSSVIHQTNPNISMMLDISTKAAGAGSTTMGWTFSAGPRVETTVTCIKQAP